MCWARNAPSSTFTAIPSPLPGTVTKCTPSAPTFEITRPPVSSIIIVSNRSVPANTNGFARIAAAVRAGRSSPTSTACPHREYASAIAVTGRGARERDFFAAPPDRFEPAGRQQGQHLKQLRARSPHRDERRFASHGDDGISGSDDRGVYAMARFDADRKSTRLDSSH